MLLLEPLWLCWFGAVVLFTWWTYQQRPAWVQPAWWRRPMGSDWRNHQLFQPAETPQQGSLAVVHALLLLSRVGEWVQLVCWIGIGWPRAASPSTGVQGTWAGVVAIKLAAAWGPKLCSECCPVLGRLWLSMLSCLAFRHCHIPLGSTRHLQHLVGAREKRAVLYICSSAASIFFFTCDWDFVFCVLYDFPVITHAPWLSLQQCLFLARRANLKASSWALYCASSSDDVCGFHLIMPIFK